MTATGSLSIFTGPNGVRAGWRLLVFLAIAVVLFGPFVLFIQPRLQRLFGTDFTAVNLILGDAVALTLLLITAVITARIERRSLEIYGLPPSASSAASSGPAHSGASSCFPRSSG
jgi:hypothetical protein